MSRPGGNHFAGGLLPDEHALLHYRAELAREPYLIRSCVIVPVLCLAQRPPTRRRGTIPTYYANEAEGFNHGASGSKVSGWPTALGSVLQKGGTMSLVSFPRVSAALVSVLLVAALPPVVTSPSSANDSTVEEGTPLPPLWEPDLSTAPLWGGASGYVMHDRRQSAEGDPTVLTVVRTDDGTVVRTFTLGPRDSNPQVVGSSFVQEHFAGWSGPVDGVEVTNVETGETRTTPVGSGQNLVRGDEDWVLVRSYEDGSSGHRLKLVRPDGSTTSVSGPVVQPNVRYVGGDAHHAYLRDTDNNGPNVFHVDVDTATVTLVPEPADGWGAVYVTPHRVISRTPADGGSVQRFSWWSRTSADGGVVEAATPAASSADKWFPFGDRMLLMDGTSSSEPRHTLLPVDFTDGGYDEAVATDVTDVQDLGDGRLALAVADRPTGSVAVLADDGAGPRHVTDLPQVARRAVHPELNGDWVYSTFEGPGPTPQVTRSDGSGGWQEDVTPFTTAGDVTLTTSPPDADGHYVSRLTWPEGSRELHDVTPVLGHGGLLVGVPVTRDGVERWEIQDVRTGDVVRDLPRDPSEPIAIDRRRVWFVPDWDGVMTGFDTTGAHPDMRVRTGKLCFPDDHLDRYFDVRGRFALYTCEGWRFFVSDIHEVVPTWVVTTPQYVAPELGDGFLLAPRIVTEPDGYTRSVVLDAWELVAGRTRRTYGPLWGVAYRQSVSFDVDEADTRRALYVDRFGQPRMVDLSWVRQAPSTRPDETAPTLTSGPDVPQLVAGSDLRSYTWSWTYRDDGSEFEPASGVDSYDVRVRTQTGRDTYGTWTRPESWQGMSTASVSHSVAPGSGECLAARARDKAGNVSGWSAQRCAFVDGGAPLLEGRAGPRVLTYTNGAFAFRYGASDDYEVASYDISYRVAKPGELKYGTWRTTRQATETDLLVYVRPGSDWCFRFRARDTLGQVSSWSAPRCRAVPVDDADYSRARAAFRGQSKKAIEHTYTELNLPGAYITFRRQAGRAVVLSVLRGPGQGSADVFFADRLLGRIRLAAPTTRRVFVTLRLPSRATGTVRVVEVGKRPVRVDAIAMLR
jgi:hypothetical protein